MSGPLTDKQQRILVLFKVAIERERDAQKLYAEMLQHCDDPDLRAILESLRASELSHEELLQERYAVLRRSTDVAH